MKNLLLIYFGKTVSKIARTLNLGNGSTWPGHIALLVNKKIISELLSRSHVKIILIAGTNGKTTTARLIRTVLEENGKKVIQNRSGANLLNGIASSLLLHTDVLGRLKQDYALFEVDENILPLILKEIKPDYLILLNLFRDQLDRYGEVNTIAKKWKNSLEQLSEETMVILNADDPQIAFLGEKRKNIKYFGCSDVLIHQNKLEHAADSVFCPRCNAQLVFKTVYFSHLGEWYCEKCSLRRPRLDDSNFQVYPLSGIYNKYNTLAAVLLLNQVGVKKQTIEKSFSDFKPAFGRQEKVLYKGKSVQLFLSKNPTSFNQSYTTIRDLGAKSLLIVLNNKIPDGRDVSWIWDVDLPGIESFKHILISGDRVYDMALRLKYEDYKNFQTYQDLTDAVKDGVKLINKDETFYILPTYSAMLEVRKVLTGKKIL